MVREDMKTLQPDHWLYDAFTHTRGLGEKDLSLALALGEAVDVDLPRPRSQTATRSSERFLAVRNELHELIASQQSIRSEAT